MVVFGCLCACVNHFVFGFSSCVHMCVQCVYVLVFRSVLYVCQWFVCDLTVVVWFCFVFVRLCHMLNGFVNVCTLCVPVFAFFCSDVFF